MTPARARILAIAAALLLPALPVAAAVPAATIPPSGSAVIVVMVSDGLALLPVDVTIVPPLACDRIVGARAHLRRPERRRHAPAHGRVLARGRQPEVAAGRGAPS